MRILDLSTLRRVCVHDCGFDGFGQPGGRFPHSQLRPAHQFNGNLLEISDGQGQEYGKLLQGGNRGEFRLFEACPDASPVLDGPPAGLIQAGPEADKGFELLELGIGQFEVARGLTKGPALRLAAHAGNGPAHVHRRQHAQLVEGGREADLAVRDGNQVGGDVGGDVLGLGLDDGQGRERPSPEFRASLVERSSRREWM